MKQAALPRRIAAFAALLGLSFLSACMFSPGKFASSLDIRKDGRFSFTYQGEIHVLALSDFATRNAAPEEFRASRCFDTDQEGSETDRQCTREEIAAQKEEWARQQSAAKEKREGDARQMRSALGGFDPDDPKAGEELARRLRRQTGFRSVSYKGNGLYWVDYSITSSLTHDFGFPSIEGFPITNAFIMASLRNDGTVRIDAPGFTASGGNPAAAMMMGAMSARTNEAASPDIPVPDGVFALTTDGEILSNNTDEGPHAVADGHRLVWQVHKRNPSAPMALLKLSRQQN